MGALPAKEPLTFCVMAACGSGIASGSATGSAASAASGLASSVVAATSDTTDSRRDKGAAQQRTAAWRRAAAGAR